MKRTYVFIGGLVIFVLAMYVLVEDKYRAEIYGAARNREDIYRVLFYSAGITPQREHSHFFQGCTRKTQNN